MTQYVGFLASTLIIISVTSSQMLRLRIMALAGGATYVAYGVLAEAWPVVVTNVVTLLLHAGHLGRWVRLGRWSSVASAERAEAVDCGDGGDAGGGLRCGCAAGASPAAAAVPLAG